MISLLRREVPSNRLWANALAACVLGCGATGCGASTQAVRAPTTTEAASSSNGPGDTAVASDGIAAPNAELTADVARLVEFTERARALRFATPPTAGVAAPDHLAALSQTQWQSEERALLSIGEAVGLYEPSAEGLQAPAVFLDATSHRLILNHAQLEENHVPRAPTRALAHDLIRTLALELLRQRFGDVPDATIDESNARWALREGDASLVAGSEAGGGLGAGGAEEHTRLPHEAGLRFARALHGRFGLASLNLAHAHPPTTTEQILHPELYIQGEAPPEPFALPELAAMQTAGFAALPEDTLGEFEISLFFGAGAPGGPDPASAAGWDGDRIRVYTRRSNGAYESAFVWVMRWDSVTDAEEAERAARRLAISDGVIARRQGRWLLVHLGLGSNATAEAEASFAAIIAAHPSRVTADPPESEPVVVPSAVRSREPIRTTIRAHLEEVRACYEAQLEFEPTLEGRVLTYFVVSPEGCVSDTEIQESSLSRTTGATHLTDCLQALLETIPFPAEPGTQPLGVTYPFVFAPDDEAE